ncbi:glycosyl hydrolase 53 family protein [Galbibacter sp. EGI 63066]|uniref:glycoside hydrolase family 53 protein n=1 Tax=Galbibacter sp. EGI 63066 TaxID=2993559 RepID=UPI0022487C57|nr:glycosyl hydrolase 53 family protein [Galbibacter sp. EGI 63066]MCX2679786.1 glycosyl hydrolase 53 family protein [Galbibacter sp. EGI 63066]
MKYKHYLFIVLILLTGLLPVNAQDYAIGADLSFLKMSEDNGSEFKENGVTKPGLEIFKDHGYNWIRLRLFHSPDRLPNNLEYTIALAKEAKQMGYKFLLDFHYSDTWADPSKQYLPKAWQNLPFDELVKAVYDYTLETMTAFKDSLVYPDMVQVGNEISNGFLWPHGKLPDNWDNFAQLMQAGVNGVLASCGDQPCPRLMVHIDRGGNKEFTKNWYDKFHTYNIRYDIIGQSYYPWWHGSLLDLKENMYFMATEYKKDIILVEVAYNWAPAEYKEKAAPFEESPEGQKEFLEEVNEIVLNTPDNRGKGIFWWEPAVGRWGTRGFFDKEGNVLPVITVFDKYTRH